MCVVSGVGPGRAYRAAGRLIALGVERILSMGVSGGLEPALRAGTLVVGTVVREHVPGQVPETVWQGSPEEAESIVRLLEKARLSATPGRLVTVPAPALTLDAKRFLRTDHDALAVDMESSAVARAAAEAGLPYLAVRAICDDAEREVPAEVVRAVSESGQTGLGKVLAMILKKPSLLPRLMAMGREYNKALKSLGKAFDALASVGFSPESQ